MKSTPTRIAITNICVLTACLAATVTDFGQKNRHLRSPSPSSTASTIPSTDAPFNESNYKHVCGRQLYPTPRIAGGHSASFAKWPWQIIVGGVSVTPTNSTFRSYCGGALITETWAVTAAHCFEKHDKNDTMLVWLGDYDTSTFTEPLPRLQLAAKYVKHEMYKLNPLQYDIALLRLPKPIRFQVHIIPVCLPDNDDDFVGSSAYVTGWGQLQENGSFSTVLQELKVPVISNSECETMFRVAGYYQPIPEILVCAGIKEGGVDTCLGDSGGPLVIQRPDKRWMLAGITSSGNGCARPNQPGKYTRVSKFNDWINKNMEKYQNISWDSMPPNPILPNHTNGRK